MQQFLGIFSELKNKKLYLSGESVRHAAVLLHLSTIHIFSSMPGNICLVCDVATLVFHTRTENRFYAVIANYIYEHPGVLDLDLQGIWIADRKYLSIFAGAITHQPVLPASLSWDVVQEQIPAVDFVHKYENVFALKFVLELKSEFLLTYDNHSPAKRLCNNWTILLRNVTTRDTPTSTSNSHHKGFYRSLGSRQAQTLAVMSGT